MVDAKFYYNSVASLNIYTVRQHEQHHRQRHMKQHKYSKQQNYQRQLQPERQKLPGQPEQKQKQQWQHQQKQKQPRQRRRDMQLYYGNKRSSRIDSSLSTARRTLMICAMVCLLTINLPTSDAFRIMDWVDGETPKQFKNGDCAEVLSLSEISELRVREIKYKLQRKHGYGSDEVYRILDKKELVNKLAFEEHKICEMEGEWKKKVMVRRSIFMAFVCVVLVMFWPLFKHVWEVACVNFVVYTDRKIHEIGRCRDLKSYKGAFGILLMSLVECLKSWLTLSVILSWVMTSKYFFPIPSISVRPAAILAGASGMGSGNNPLAGYGINVGPMVITFCLRFLNSRIERWLGRVLSEASKRQNRERKEARIAREWMASQDAKQERKAARATRRAEREARRQAAEAAAPDPITSTVNGVTSQMENSNNSTSMNNGGQANSTGGVIRNANDDDSHCGMNDLD